jgi:hypothetical protein
MVSSLKLKLMDKILRKYNSIEDLQNTDTFLA